MLKRRIIPCLDVRDGRVVKGVHFGGLRDAGDPVAAARLYDEQGADEICLLDITATAEGRATFVDVVRQVAAQIFCPLTVGGGVRRRSDVARLLDAGADKVAINSGAVINPALVEDVAARYGRQCIVAAVDVRRLPPRRAHPGSPAPAAPAPGEPTPDGPAPQPSEHDDAPVYEVVIQGGARGTGLEAVAWCETVVRLGAGEILLTSMDRDGTKRGYDLDITRTISRAVPVPVIASGGVGELAHLYEGLATGGGEADAALAASIFHFGLHTIPEAKRYLAGRGIPVRPSSP